MSRENILQEADKITDGDREKCYGSPLHDFTRVAKLWSVILGAEVKPEHVALCMIQIKISREINKHKRDNLVDIAGYARVLEKLLDEERHNLLYKWSI